MTASDPHRGEPAEREKPAGPGETAAQRARHPVLVALGVTAVVTALSYGAPDEYAATAVGAAFVFAVIALVLRQDASTIRHFGLSLGGVLEPEPLDLRRATRDSGRALGWALGLTAAIAAPFFYGFRHYWGVSGSFHLVPPLSIADELFGQALVIALPEEAFYRGYLMTALEDRWGPRWTVLGVKLGWGWIASSALFAVGHALTIPRAERLAVFFPALLFGWLRARTRGVGAPVLLHVFCNVLASTVERGFAAEG